MYVCFCTLKIALSSVLYIYTNWTPWNKLFFRKFSPILHFYQSSFAQVYILILYLFFIFHQIADSYVLRMRSLKMQSFVSNFFLLCGSLCNIQWLSAVIFIFRCPRCLCFISSTFLLALHLQYHNFSNIVHTWIWNAELEAPLSSIPRLGSSLTCSPQSSWS